MEPKMEPCMFSDFEHFNRVWQIFFQMLEFSKFENMEGLHFGLHFSYFLKIWLDTRSILSAIKNQIDSIKSHLYIQKWSALKQIFKKVIRHSDFRAWKWSSRAPKSKFSQYVNSRELKKFSRIAITLIFFPNESWQSKFFKYVKIGAQNGAPE